MVLCELLWLASAIMLASLEHASASQLEQFSAAEANHQSQIYKRYQFGVEELAALILIISNTIGMN